MPLVQEPITRKYRYVGPRSEIEITVEACPDQWVRYSGRWTRIPPTGITALLEGQVTFLRPNGGKGAPSASKIRIDSRKNEASAPPWRGQCWELHEVHDFSFAADVLEKAE